MVTRAGDPYPISGTITAQVAGTLTAAVSNVVTAEARGQVTAVGTVTAAISTVVTAEARGQVTAVGTVTAQVGIVTALASAGGGMLQARSVTVGTALIVGQMRRTDNLSDGQVSPSTVATPDTDGTVYQPVLGMYFNGASWDRHYNNWTAVLLASASDVAGARTAADQINYGHPGVVIWLNIYGTASTATIGGVIVQGKHNGRYATLTAFARTLTAPGLYPFAFHPGAGAGTLVSGAAPMILPRDWRAIVSGALDANASAAYQLDAHYVGYG